MKKVILYRTLVAALAPSLYAQQTVVGGVLPTTGTIDFVGDVVTLTIPPDRGYASIGVSSLGTFVGTVEVQCAARTSTDTFVPLTLAPRNSSTTATTITASGGQWQGSIAGCARVRAIATAWTSGSLDITMNGSFASSAVGGGGSGSNAAAAATGSAVPADASYTAINVGGTLRGWTGFSLGSHFAGALAIVDGSGNQITSFGGGTQYTQDAALTVGTSIGTMAMGRASAAVPTDVSADNDAVMPWYLRSGAVASQPTFGGVLAVAGNGGVGTGVQRVTLANDSTGVIATVGAVTSITNTVNTIGTIANDAGAAATNRIPTLPMITETSAPTRTDGRNGALSGTVGGAARVMITNAAGAATTIATDTTQDSAAATTGPQVMGIAKNTTLPTAVTDGDAVRLLTDLQGRLRPKNVCEDPELVDSVVISTASSGNVELVAVSGSTMVIACGFNVIAGGTVGVQFISGTGTACATNEVNETGVYPLIINSGINSGFGAPIFKGLAGDAICVELSTTVQIDGVFTYARVSVP